MQMLICSHDFLLRVWVHVWCPFCRDKVLDTLARHGFQRHITHWMTEEDNRVSRPRAGLATDSVGAICRERNTVDGAAEEAVRPVRKEITNVDEDGRAWVVLSAGWADRDGSPCTILLQDFQAGLALQTEEQSDGSIVGVRTCTNLVACMRSSLWRRIPQEAQDGAR